MKWLPIVLALVLVAIAFYAWGQMSAPSHTVIVEEAGDWWGPWYGPWWRDGGNGARRWPWWRRTGGGAWPGPWTPPRPHGPWPGPRPASHPGPIPVPPGPGPRPHMLGPGGTRRV